ncbi:glycoside hydrolase 43 family protein [Salipaludibacillus neizhouensis]|uniref:Glycoside hydrolase 43 family protein n=1 Tax=Salipaludibacillus neizhouensis TaxID=885475 RepID=A0A3A9JZA5_9BACI|nr:glycoside hydrolase family 43 protein [Salipaludibacillus neizhouensis]RKL65519.1 glycoside hydrolase 43 family protein [Salipaludibacillus neizhouensis]
MKYKNPVISGFHPDPSICKVGENFFLVTSSFEYFPGIPIFQSKNLVNWEQIGHVLTREAQLPLKREHSFIPSQGIFAPTIRYHKGRFYVITTNITIRKTFYVWAEHPEGPWSDPIFIDGFRGYDPSLFFDDNDKVYITGASFPGAGPEGIFQAELDIDSGKMISESQFVWEGTGGSSPEGPHLYKINDWYYLLVAEGGTEYGHMVTIARSRKPYGPFESNPHNPILSNRSTKLPIQATGHADLIQASDGTWWAVFLGFRPVKSTKVHHLGRETNLAAVEWSEEGWPVIGENGRAKVEHDAKLLLVNEPTPWLERDDFNCESLATVWNFYRNPLESSWSLTEQQGFLTLYGQSCTLNDLESPTFVGRRQQHFNCEVSTLMEFSPTEEGEEAGLTVFMNENYHYDIAKMIQKGQTIILFRCRVGSLWKVVKEILYDEPSVVLKIKATDTSFTFSYATPTGEEKVIGSGETSLLSTQIAGGFTGLYFGLYATGNGKCSTAPAHFDYFQYVPGQE